jgi:hypothetical protein
MGEGEGYSSAYGKCVSLPPTMQLQPLLRCPLIAFTRS